MGRRTAEDWSRLVRSWERSGQTCAEFCAARGVNRHTLSWWKWRLGRWSASSNGGTAGHGTPLSFVDYGRERTAPVGGARRDGFIGVEVGRYTVQVPADFDAGSLTRLLGLLELRGTR